MNGQVESLRTASSQASVPIKGVPSMYGHPSDIVSHPSLTKAEKRAILASWVSDTHAVKDAPALRQLDNGAVVSIDEILQALKALDDGGAGDKERPKTGVAWNFPFARRQDSLLARWHRKSMVRPSQDDDDDPPPCPVAAALPVRMAFVAA